MLSWTVIVQGSLKETTIGNGKGLMRTRFQISKRFPMQGRAWVLVKIQSVRYNKIDCLFVGLPKDEGEALGRILQVPKEQKLFAGGCYLMNVEFVITRDSLLGTNCYRIYDCFYIGKRGSCWLWRDADNFT